MSVEENSRLSRDWLINTIQAKYVEQSLSKLVSIAYESACSAGDNFTSDIQRVKMIFKNESESKQFTVMLVAKMNKPVEQSNNEEDGLFNNSTEVKIYANVLPQMEELMIEFNDQRETLWPIMYGHVPYSVLLLEDLGRHYKMVSRTEWLGEEYALLGLRALGRYHAMSKILIERGHIGEHYRDNFICGIKTPMHESVFKGCMQLLSRAMIKKVGCWKAVEFSESWGKRLESLTSTIYEERVKIYLNYDRRFQVLNHGDFRSNNMMFRTMEYTGRPTDVKFFDFQLPHINSFVWDLAYFFSISVDPSVRRSNRAQLLEAYERALADNLKFFNFEGYIPTMDDVVKEMNRAALVEFSNMCCVTPLLISSFDDSIALDKVTTIPPEEAINGKVFIEERFVNGVVGDIKRAIDLEII